MWDRIKQIWQKESPSPTLQLSEQEQRMLLEQTHQALHQGQYEVAERQAHQLSSSAITEIAQEGMRQLGLVYFHQHQYKQAWPIFERLAKQTGHANDWFNLVTSATLDGELQKGSKAFDQAIKAHNEGEDNGGLCAATMHHYYGCALRDQKEYAKAFEQIEILRALYQKLPKTDARTLDLRGFPRLDAVLDLMVDVLAHSGDIPEAEQWLRQLGEHLKPDAQPLLEQAISRLARIAPQPSTPAALSATQEGKTTATPAAQTPLHDRTDPSLD